MWVPGDENFSVSFLGRTPGFDGWGSQTTE